MKKMWKPLAVLAAGLLAGPAVASEVSDHGILTVDDGGHVFTADGVQKAKALFEGTTFKSTTHFSIVTYDKVPSSKRADFELIKNDKDRKRSFMRDWAVDAAKSHREKGVFVLICTEASSVRTIVDRQSDHYRGFSDDKARKVDDAFVAGFKAAIEKKGEDAILLHDAALMKATEFVVDELKDTSAPAEKTTSTSSGRNTNSGSSSIMSYVCIGIAVLLGIWLVVGIIRAFTGGGGGGGGGYGGGGYGGGGGGGFFSSMIGGMFGAAAGMWMYNSFFGGGMHDLSAGDYGGGSSGADNVDTGAGDFDGGADGGGGDWGGSDAGGGGDAGGGDWGGGDGGGGDFGGGGGGDFGGGDW